MLQAKVRELTRMHEARSRSAGPRDAPEAGVGARGGHLAQHSGAAADSASVCQDADSADMCEEMRRAREDEERCGDVVCAADTHAAAGGRHPPQRSQSGAPGQGSVSEGDGAWPLEGERAGGWAGAWEAADANGQVDEVAGDGDAAALHAIIGSLAADAMMSTGGASSAGDACCGATVARGAKAPGVAAELAAQLSGLIVAEEPRERRGEAGGSGVWCGLEETAEAPREGRGGRRRGEDQQSLRRELLDVRGLIAEMRQIRDAVAAGELSQPAGGRSVRSPQYHPCAQTVSYICSRACRESTAAGRAS